MRFCKIDKRNGRETEIQTTPYMSMTSDGKTFRIRSGTANNPAMLLALVMSREEIAQLAAFASITDAELEQARKSKGREFKFTED